MATDGECGSANATTMRDPTARPASPPEGMSREACPAAGEIVERPSRIDTRSRLLHPGASPRGLIQKALAVYHRL
jgi:hypothetical protein